jgi:alkylation response protein AidB-like acyl-CoA dehydrogenase
MVFLGAAERCSSGAGSGAGGPLLLFVPRLLPDGQRNGVHLERLKDKFGNRSNASSEVEFFNACGWLVGKRAMASGKSSKWAA